MSPAISCDLFALFVAVADEGSFTKAGVRLGLTKSTISRAIARLEAAAGVELVRRTTHHVVLSAAGRALYESAAPQLNALQQSLGSLREHARRPAGELRITAPPDLGVLLLPGLLAEFSRRYSEITFDLHLSNLSLDLIRDGFDVALRATPRPLPDSGMSMRRLGNAVVRYYASPAYLAEHGKPRQLGDPEHSWVDFSLQNSVVPRASRVGSARFQSSDFFLIRELLRQGMGIGPLPTFVASELVRSGSLAQALPQTQWPAAGGVFLLYRSGAQLPHRVIAFRDFLIQYLKKHPIEQSAGK